jgi:hypothetical protein
MTLTDLPDAELRFELSGNALGSRVAAIARAILRRRKAERLAEWLKRHGWLGALLAAVRSAGLFPASEKTKRSRGPLN